MPASRFASATPTSASRLTAAVCALPSEAKYWTSSYTSFIVNDKISIPMRPTSGAATSLTSVANWSRSLYTSSTDNVPESYPQFSYLDKRPYFEIWIPKGRDDIWMFDFTIHKCAHYYYYIFLSVMNWIYMWNLIIYMTFETNWDKIIEFWTNTCFRSLMKWFEIWNGWSFYI